MVAAEFQTQSQSESHVALFSPQELRQQPLPPSERDFQVFEEVVIGGASTRAAAATFGVSQTRIVQVRQRVAEWMGAEVPPTPRLTPMQRLRLAAEIAERRADFLYSQAMEGWRATQQPLTSVCRGNLGNETRTRERHGDPRYLLAAMRISERQLQLSGTIRKVLAEAEDQESGKGGLEDCSRFNVQGSILEEENGAEGDLESENPPVRACSLDGAGLAAGHEIRAAAVDVTDCQNDVCNEFDDGCRAFLAAPREDAAPVQPSLAEAVVLSRPLSRKERRARQRLLERKLRKAK